MKKTIILTIIVALFWMTLVAGNEKEALYKEIYRLYGQQKYPEALKTVETGIKKFGLEERLIQLKYDILLKLKKYDTALAFIDSAIKASGETENLLSAKINILLLQKKYPEALEAALKKEKMTRPRSPWDCINIVNIHVRLKNKEEALNWLQEAANRGFISYRILDEKKYTLIQGERRFFEIIESIKLSIGLGKPAKLFSINLVTGPKFDLSRQRGKVILLDFWATWCDACTRETPPLKEFYRQFREKGFDIIGISLDSSRRKMREYLEKEKIEWKIAFSGKVWEDPTVKLFEVDSIPSTWLIDKNGVLRSFGLQGKALGAAISTLLSE